jgi:ribonuclease T1
MNVIEACRRGRDIEFPIVRTLRRARRPLVALVALAAALAVGYGVRTGDGHTTGRPNTAQTTASVAAVAVSELPPQVATTVHLIQRGGPFPYPDNDGVVFHNFEHRLPSEPDGYYHEYTVPTPNSPDRGIRRIISGADGGFWYTDDHYETFEHVDVGG